MHRQDESYRLSHAEHRRRIPVLQLGAWTLQGERSQRKFCSWHSVLHLPLPFLPFLDKPFPQRSFRGDMGKGYAYKAEIIDTPPQKKALL